jgi:hypothetical protein
MRSSVMERRDLVLFHTFFLFAALERSIPREKGCGKPFLVIAILSFLDLVRIIEKLAHQ